MIGRRGSRLVLAAALAGTVAGLPTPRSAAAAPTAAFERPGGGPRAAAIGGHSIVLPDDDYALGANPARLAFAGRSASAQYDRIDPAVDLWRGRVGLSLPIGGEITEPLQTSRSHRAALGAALDVLNLTLIEGSGYRESAATLGFAAAPSAILAFGVAGHYERATSDADLIAAHAWGVDVGMTIDLADHWSAALAVRDALGRVTFDGGDDEDRAAEMTIGLAARAHRFWQAEADYVFQRNTTSALAGGVEIHVLPGVLDLRGGVSREMLGPARIIPSAGAGFTVDHLRLDYAYRSDPDGGMNSQHQVALGVRF
ncbi:MAG: hypothetical protein ABI960_01170 [Candidatus Eisenbacteria bacterium]